MDFELKHITFHSIHSVNDMDTGASPSPAVLDPKWVANTQSALQKSFSIIDKIKSIFFKRRN